MVAPGDRGALNTQAMTAVLAYNMQARGKDATGILTVDQRGRWVVRKKDEPAQVFVAGRRGIGINAVTALIHTRAATQGRPEKMVNNHPIASGNIVGIHNGVLHNDDALFAHYKMQRIGEVDSEAIFATINHLGAPAAFEQLDGSWAIAWVNTAENPQAIHLARGSSSPMHYALTERGSVVFASTKDAVVDAFEYGGATGKPTVINVAEGVYMTTDPINGGIITHDTFDGSGRKAIGARPSRTWRNGRYVDVWDGYDDWEMAAAMYGGSGSHYTPKDTTTTTTPKVERATLYSHGKTTEIRYVNGVRFEVGKRYYIKGDEKNPTPGDERRWCDNHGNVHVEVLNRIDSQGTRFWNRLIGNVDTCKNVPLVHMDTVALDREHAPKAPTTPEVPSAPSDDSSSDVGTDITALREQVADEIAKATAAEHEDDGQYGDFLAEPHDIILFDKDLLLWSSDAKLGHSSGAIAAEVVDISKDGLMMKVSFRDAWLPRYDSLYEVGYRRGGALPSDERLDALIEAYG